ncbi:serine hydrolase domain-containing protein [Limosilactobacillus sp.]|uniref:serine hydrolase domain-containing protein n=1 Tax=Limosilactobacillus sp. TaxID=2773925 RepID=UPI00345ED1E1
MADYEKTRRLMQAMVHDRVVPGLSYVIFDGDSEWSDTMGLSQWRPEPEPLTAEMVYDLASLTKVVGTVPLITQLIQEGKVAFDQPVTDFLPELDDRGPTIQNLLTHTSAISGWIPNRNQLNCQQLTQAFLHDMKVGNNLNREIRYADVNFIYLGWIAERICHAPVQELITERVLKPLGLSHTTFHPAKEQAVPTEIQPERGLIKGETHDPKGYILGEHCGCAGLFSTAQDLATYGRSLIEDRLGGLLNQSMVDAIFADQTPLPGEHLRSLGWQLYHDPHDRHYVIAHTGFTGTWMMLDRQRDRGFIFLSNRVHPRAKNDEFLRRRGQVMASFLNE